MDDIVLIDRKAAVPLSEEGLSGFLDRGLFREAGDIDARDHDFADVSLFEISHGENQFSFLGIKVRRKLRLVKNFEDLVPYRRERGRFIMAFWKEALEHFHADSSPRRKNSQEDRSNRGKEFKRVHGSCGRENLHEHICDERGGNDDRSHGQDPETVIGNSMSLQDSEGMVERGLGQENKNGDYTVAKMQDVLAKT